MYNKQIIYHLYITLDQFIIDKKIKKDLTKKENNNYKPKRGDEYEKIKKSCDKLEDLLKKNNCCDYWW